MNDETDAVRQGRAKEPGFCAEWAAAVQAGSVPPASLTAGSFAFSTPLGGAGQLLAVDRFAQRTLCYGVRDGALAVSEHANEVAAGSLDPQALFDYLFFHVIPSPRTVFNGVSRLPAGHYGVWDGQSVRLKPYSGLRFAVRRDRSFEDLKTEFRSLLAEAVRSELTGGVPACFLSGGTDSSTVAGLIRQEAGSVQTYSIGFDAEGYDEMEYARIAARHFGADHREYYVTPEDLVQFVGHVAGACDQPFGNSSALPAYLCAVRAREDGVSKLLAGDGGDELFGGNSRYATQTVYDLWARVPAWLRNGLVKPLLAAPGAGALPLVRRGRNYVRDAERGLPDRLHNYNLLLRLGTEQVLTPAFLSAVRPDSVFEQQRAAWVLAEADDELNKHLAFDWRYTLAESDLPKVRSSTALAGVEVGYPMLYDPLVEFSMTLPPEYKLKGQQLRWFFKEALKDFLPPEIIVKEKKGFGLPFGVWVCRHEALRTLATDSARSFATRGVVQPAFVNALLDDLLPQHPGYYGEMLWILMMLEQWLRRHAPDWRFDGAKGR